MNGNSGGHNFGWLDEDPRGQDLDLSKSGLQFGVLREGLSKEVLLVGDDGLLLDVDG